MNKKGDFASGGNHKNNVSDKKQVVESGFENLNKTEKFAHKENKDCVQEKEDLVLIKRSYGVIDVETVAQQVRDHINLIVSNRNILPILCLRGNIGAGKTTFVSAFAKNLGIKETIISPTFILARKYEIPEHPYFTDFVHIDLYRIQDKKELAHLGLESYISPTTLLCIEWPEISVDLLPQEVFWMEINHIDEFVRHMHFCVKKIK